MGSTAADSAAAKTDAEGGGTTATAEASYVVVFPSIFAKKGMRQLAANIKTILRIREQRFKSVTRDGDVILVHANDPVFAASAIGLLFGVSRVAIARRSGTGLEELVSTVSSVGGNLLLRGERFLVRVEGSTKGYTAKDAEVAATSRIISRGAEHGAMPGTEDNHDKELYAYVTQKNSYMCIFSDGGSWGTPSVKGGDRTAICAIYDELSALSCFECMRMGYDARPVVFYKKRSDLLNLARLLNRLIPRMLAGEVELEFVRMASAGSKNSSGKRQSSHTAYIGGITEFILGRSGAGSRISLAVSPGIFPAQVAEAYQRRVFERGMVPLVPLAGSGVGMYDIARELSLDEAGVRRLEAQVTSAASAGDGAAALEVSAGSGPAAADVKKITVRVGANNVHDILDSLYPPPAADAGTVARTRHGGRAR